MLAALQRRQASAGKTCAICGVHKPFSAFTRDETKPDGYYRRCKACRAARAREKRH